MKYYLFIKGINVGGHAKVDMKVLKEELTIVGFDEVSSYLNSGNIIVESDLSSAEVEAEAETLIAGKLKLEAKVFVRTARQLESIVRDSPFDGEIENDKSKALAYILSDKVPPEKYERLRNEARIVENFYPRDDVLYVYYRNGIASSYLTANYIDKVLGVVSTGRNMNTLEALMGK
ncbi:MAG: DUF1697 domain-containing protein [Rectinemataceae bacterium]